MRKSSGILFQAANAHGDVVDFLPDHRQGL